MTQRFDVAVVGAGPAGSATAYDLATAGWRVVMLERAMFPRDKACGDGITPGALSLLEDMGLGPEVARHRQIAGVRLVTGRQRRDSLFRRDTIGAAGIVIPRRELDHLLARRAVDRGAVLLENATVLGPLWVNGRVAGVRAAHAAAESAIPATFVVAADGALSPFAAKTGLLARHRDAIGYAARAYFTGVDEIESLFHCHVPLVDPETNRRIAGYGWVFPLGDGRANVGVGFAATCEHDRLVNLRRVFDAFVARLRETDSRFRRMRLFGRCQGAPVFHGVDASQCAGRNTLLVGDAAGLVDSITGEGIDRALESGKLAAAVLGAALASPHGERADLREYTQLIESRFGVRARSRRRLMRMHRFVSELVEQTLAIEGPLFESVRRELIGYAGSRPLAHSTGPAIVTCDGIDTTAVRDQVIASINDELPLLARMYLDGVAVEDTSIKTELASLAARFGYASTATLTAIVSAIELAELALAVHAHMLRTGGCDSSQRSRQSTQWSDMFTVMAGDYLLTRAHALASRLGPRISGELGRAIAGAYRGLMQDATNGAAEAAEPRGAAGIERVAVFHELAGRLSAIAAGVPDAALEVLGQFALHIGVALARTSDVELKQEALRVCSDCLTRLPPVPPTRALAGLVSRIERKCLNSVPVGVSDRGSNRAAARVEAG